MQRDGERLHQYKLLSFKMYLGYLVLVPLLLVLWTYIILIVRNNLVSNTSIEVNIIDHSSMNSAQHFSENNMEFNKPKKTVKHHVPKFMLELYEKNKSTRKNNANADLVRSLIPMQTEKLGENEVLEELSENHLLIFDIPRSTKKEKIIGAELKILTQIDIRSTKEQGVKKSIKISVYDEYSKKYSYLHKIHIHQFNNTWLSFNLIKEVESILQLNSDKKMLKIIVTVSAVYHQSQNNLKLSLVPDENFDHDYPILLLSYSIEDDRYKIKPQIVKERQETKIRRRRNIEDDYEEETNHIWNGDISKKNLRKFKRNNCRRKPLYIDFSEIKYNLWIVQPTGYDAYQCQGRCFYPVAEHLSPTKHAIMQALVHSVNPSKASRSCCVPTLLDSISILYVDDKGVLTYRYAYKDMVVLECGCR